MIKLLEKFNGSGLSDAHTSRVILSHLHAYGTSFDFCRFYGIFSKSPSGAISLFNGACAVSVYEGCSVGGGMRRELAEFVDFTRPWIIELPERLAPRGGFSGYQQVNRSFFSVPPGDSADGLFDPEPDRVFKTVFSQDDSYGLWLTDTMRRVNAGQSRLYGFESSVLTVRFTENGKAYISDVATPYEDRGKGYVRTLLAKVSRVIADSGASAYLSAAGESAEFYRYLGYPEIGFDKAFMLKKE